ncbi:phage tail tape measure protein [Streptomyces sp. NBC_00035]|uniref:phage tail tape measure protein n=1 Tax=Streptomyces sp. NBC_00035 TaxID=2903614 RepID=UPI00324851D3
MSDTSLVFNLVARDETGKTLQGVREKFDTAAAGMGVGVAAALGVGITQALDVSAASSKLVAQLGVGPAEAAELSKVSASVYENAWGDSAATVNEAIRGVYNNIGDVSKAEGGLEGVTSKALALSETFDQEVGPTTAAVGQLIRTGLADNADEAFDIITAGFQSAANKSDDFLDTINEYSTQFRRVGLDGQTATGLLAQGLEAGARDADQVADAIGQFGERALAGGTAVDTAFASIGLNAGDMAAQIGAGGASAEEALQLTMDALRGTGDEQTKLNAAAALFGDPGNVLGEALFALDPASAAASSGMDKATGSTDKLMKTMGESPAAVLESFKRKALGALADVAGGFLTFATNHQSLMEPLAYTLGGIAAAIVAVKVATIGYNVVTAISLGLTATNTAALEANGLALLIYGARMAAVRTGMAIATAAQWAWNTAFAASGIGAIIIGVTLLIAAIIYIALKTTWFQQAWSATWSAVQTAFGATVNWFMGALSWFANLPGMFAGWFGAAKDWAIGKFMELVTWHASLPGRIFAALGGLAGALRNRASSAFQAMRNAAADKASALMSWAQGIPGRIGRAVTGMNNLLYDKGADVIHGLWNGISSMGGWLWNKVTSFVSSNVVDAAKSFLHIGSPSKLMADAIGQWIPAGIAVGAEDNRGVLDKTMQGLVNPQLAAPTTPLTTGMAPLMGAQAGGGAVLVRFEFAGADGAFKTFVKKVVRVEGRGDVQIAFGQ